VKCEHCGSDLDAAAKTKGACPRCGALTGTAEKPLVLGKRYRLESTLGVGSMGVVHLARDLRNNQWVAVKLVAPELHGDPDAHYRFAREAAALAAVAHPNVIRVRGFGEDDEGNSFVAMEYVRGPSLDQIIAAAAARGEWIAVDRALALIRELAMGLDAVHAAGFVHRDVKPSNVLVEEGTGRPVLLDFGLARNPVRGSAKSLGAGTPWYMAPEQVDDEEVEGLEISARTDVYAFGCTVFELLTAVPPFETCDLDALRLQQLYEEPPPASSFRPEVAPLDAPLARALAKDPAKRPETPLALVDALDAAWAAASVLERTA
jgi:serine/threonine-protein kinase